MRKVLSVAHTLMSKALRQFRYRFSSELKLNRFTDYETYRKLQQEGNERKLGLVYAREANIAHIAQYAENRLGSVTSVLCHGTRNGTELRWFQSSLGGHVRVLGTEISSTANRFPDTIQWDFHDMKPEWEGAWDVIYTNSWDHAFDPEKAISTWLDCLTPNNGLLFLEHSKNHEPTAANDLDPFGATLEGLTDFVNGLAPSRNRVVDVISDLPDAKTRNIVVVGAI